MMWTDLEGDPIFLTGILASELTGSAHEAWF